MISRCGSEVQTRQQELWPSRTGQGAPLLSVSKNCPFLNNKCREAHLNGGVAFVSRTIGAQVGVMSQEAAPGMAWRPAGTTLTYCRAEVAAVCYIGYRLLLELPDVMARETDLNRFSEKIYISSVVLRLLI